MRCDAGEAAMVFNWGWLRRASYVDISSMTAADQIAEINAQYAERVKLLERERDAKVAMVRERCKHEPSNAAKGSVVTTTYRGFNKTVTAMYTPDICKHCGAPMP